MASESLAEPRFPLSLTARQLTELKTHLENVSASEADPDAEIFLLLELVREARKLAAMPSSIK